MALRAEQDTLKFRKRAGKPNLGDMPLEILELIAGFVREHYVSLPIKGRATWGEPADIAESEFDSGDEDVEPLWVRDSHGDCNSLGDHWDLFYELFPRYKFEVRMCEPGEFDLRHCCFDEDFSSMNGFCLEYIPLPEKECASSKCNPASVWRQVTYFFTNIYPQRDMKVNKRLRSWLCIYLD